MKKVITMLLFWQSLQSMAVPFLSLPGHELLALPPSPFQTFRMLHEFLKSKGQFLSFKKFLPEKTIHDLILIDPRLASLETEIYISDSESRAEDICDALLRKDVPACLKSLVVIKEGLELYIIREKILRLCEKNKKTLRYLVLPSRIFPEIKALNEQGLSPVNKYGKEETLYEPNNVYLENFIQLEKFSICKGAVFTQIAFLKNCPNLKILDIENCMIGSQTLKNLSLIELNLSRVKFQGQNDFFENLPCTLKKLNIDMLFQTGFDLSENPLSLFIKNIERFKNLEYLCFDTHCFKGTIEPILVHCSFLKQLYINGFARYNNSPRSLKGLCNFANLTHLSLPKAAFLEDFSEIFKLSKLEYLDLSGSSFNESKSRAVSLRHNIGNDFLKGIENLTELRYLGLSRTGVQDLRFIQNLKKLKHLNLSYSNIKHLKNIEQLENLCILDIASKTEVLGDLFKMHDIQLQSLNVFLGYKEAISEEAKKIIEALKRKGVCFLIPEIKPLGDCDHALHLTQFEENRLKNLIKMVNAYKEDPFLHCAYTYLIKP